MRTRSRISRLLGAAIPVVVCAFAVASGTYAGEALTWEGGERPNIIFIEVDDLTYSYTGVFGSEKAKTPEIDKLAKDGVVFRNAMCQGMMCGPSRNCQITGTYPHQLGLYQNGQMDTLPQGIWSFPAALQRAGYTTAWIGKNHLRPYGGADHNAQAMKDEMGFDYALQTLGRSMLRGRAKKKKQPDNPYFEYLITNNLFQVYKEDALGKRNTRLPEEAFLDGWFTEQTIRYIGDNKSDNPFFIWLNYSLPHAPFDVADSYHEPFSDLELKGFGAPKNYRHSEEVLNSRSTKHLGEQQTIENKRGVLAANFFVDGQLGKLRRFLASTGLDKKTILVFFSDHGYLHGELGLNQKYALYRQVTNPCLIISYPEVFRSGVVEGQAVELTDLLPTCLEIAGAPEVDRGPHGVSLLPLLTGEGAVSRDYAFGEIYGWVVAADRALSLHPSTRWRRGLFCSMK